MSGGSVWFLLAGAAAALLAAFLYRYRELPVRGRGLLAFLRILAFLLVGFLLANPGVPGLDPDRPARGGVRVLIHADPSLELPGTEGRLLDEVMVRAEALGRMGATLALAIPGERATEAVDASALPRRTLPAPGVDLAAGVARLAELGADTIVLLSTLRISAAEWDRLQRSTGVPLRIERFGGGVRNVAVAELDLPERIPAGGGVEGSVALFGEGGAPGDEVEVEIRGDGTLLERLVLPLPEPGSVARADFRLPVPPDGRDGVRYTARVTAEGDVFPADDERVRWVEIGEPVGGVLLLSFRPDWEPGVLLPVLTEVTGLEGEGYLSAGGRWLSLESGDAPVRTLEASALAARMASASLLVLHGIGSALEAPLRVEVEAHPRVLLLPDGPEGTVLVGVQSERAGSGDWPVLPEIPPSPVRPFLEGVRLGTVPPLGEVLVQVGGVEGLPVLRIRPEGSDRSAAAVILVTSGERRRAVALATGFWRWGVRDGEPRSLYRGLWAGVAGWLLERSGTPGFIGVRPGRPVVDRGPISWIVSPEFQGGEVQLQSSGEGGTEPRPGLETGPDSAPPESFPIGTAGSLQSPPLPPGRYQYTARAPDGGGEVNGSFEVEAWVPSLRHPPVEGPRSETILAAGESGDQAQTRPLRTHPLPYLLLLGLLSAEWIGRRRIGLR